MNYTTLEALRRWGTFQSPKDDGMLEATIASASRIIDRHCGRVFASSAETIHTFTRPLAGMRRHDPFDHQTLFLDDDLAAAASAISGSPTVSYITANHPPYWAIINEDGYWSSPISVTGHWAYSEQAPPDIEIACLRLSKWLYELRDTARGDAVVVTDQGAVLMPAALPADVLAILAPYVKTRIGR